MKQLDYNNGNRVFSSGPCRDVIREEQRDLMGICEESI
jgi:hypothetical protein